MTSIRWARKRRRLLSPGQRFGSFLVLCEVAPHLSPNGKRRPRYECRCACGETRLVLMQNLLNGQSTSCGCVGKERQRAAVRRHGDTGTRLYQTWCALKGRCQCPSHVSYPDYGGRGITVCPEWRDGYEAFRDWARANGYRRGLEIDRIDNEAGYGPANCRWVMRKQNTRNTRLSRLVTAFGETRCLAAWAEDPRCSVASSSLAGRLDRGWDPEAAITTPHRGCGRPRKS